MPQNYMTRLRLAYMNPRPFTVCTFECVVHPQIVHAFAFATYDDNEKCARTREHKSEANQTMTRSIFGSFVAATVAISCSSTGAAPSQDAAAQDGAATTSDATDAAASDAPSTDAPVATGPQNIVYGSFVINIHDWVYVEESIVTVNRLIDLHEKYKLPVDMYMTDPMLQAYLTKALPLIERIKASPYVAISHHLRPPSPYYAGYDWLGLNKLSSADVKVKLRSYEEHAIDLSTGEPTTAPGGYEYMKQVFGYPPYVVTSASDSSVTQKALAEIYKEKGAKFALVHDDNGTEWGEKRNEILMRPETVELKVYEAKNEIDFKTKLLDPAMTTIGNKRPAFINMKWHDDNFNSSGTPWINVYYADGETKSKLNPRPWDPKAIGTIKMKTAEEKAIQWKRYETALQYFVDHPEFGVAGARQHAKWAGLE